MACHPDKDPGLNHHPDGARNHAREDSDKDEEYQTMGKGTVSEYSSDQP